MHALVRRRPMRSRALVVDAGFIVRCRSTSARAGAGRPSAQPPGVMAIVDRSPSFHCLRRVGWRRRRLLHARARPQRRTDDRAGAARLLAAARQPASVLHVVGLAEHPRWLYAEGEHGPRSRSSRGHGVRAAGGDARRHLRRNGGGRCGRGYSGSTASTALRAVFYRAAGTFNLAATSAMHWIADLLAAAGVPTAPVLATMPQGLLWDVAEARGSARRLPRRRSVRPGVPHGDTAAWPISSSRSPAGTTTAPAR